MNEEIKKSGKPKKTTTIIFVITVVLIIFAIIAGLLFKSFYISDADREEALINAGKEYYEEYMSNVTGLNEALVTVEMLQKVVETNDADYDLSLLEKCENDTKVSFTLVDGEITDETVELNCK